MEYYHFFVDAWRLFKKYRTSAVDTEAYFDTMIDAASVLVEKYSRIDSFAFDIMKAIVNELERIVKEGG